MTVGKIWIDMIGYAAATMTTISFVPQLMRVIRLRSARDISLTMFLVFSTGIFAWLVCGVLSESAPVLIASAVTFLLSMSILTLKLRFDRSATSPKQMASAPR